MKTKYIRRKSPVLFIIALVSTLAGMPSKSAAQEQCVNVNVYSGFTDSGGGAPYSDLVESFMAASVSFASDTGYSWHPSGLTDFGADITGALCVAAAGTYSFALDSDDGSLLFIDGNLVVDNGGSHSPTTASGNATLTAGLHTFEVQFFECCGDPSGVDLILPDNVSYACPGNKCPLSVGYWKTHPDAWPVTTLTLGTVSYTQAELLAILKTSPGSGTKADASLILADQLIAAKLNVANGSNPCLFADPIAAADALIDGRTIPITPKITPNTAEGQQMVSLANTLAQLNAQTSGCTP